MEEQVAQKSSELEQYLQRVRELEEMYKQLQEALEDEKQARQDEETVRKLQARYGFGLLEIYFNSPLPPAIISNCAIPLKIVCNLDTLLERGTSLKSKHRIDFFFPLSYEG